MTGGWSNEESMHEEGGRPQVVSEEWVGFGQWNRESRESTSCRIKWKQPKWPLMEEWIKMMYIYTMEY